MAAAASRLPPLMTARDIVRVYGLSAMKSLDQNFLLDMNLCRKFVRAAGDLRDAHVCEVGPGPGGITRALLETNLRTLSVVEKDRRFLPSLEMLVEASDGRLRVRHGDIMRTNVVELLGDEGRTASRAWHDEELPRIHVVGNLPFSVSTGLLIQWLREISQRSGPFALGRIPLLLFFQKEVAERIVAPVMGNQRCRLSLMTQYLTEPTLKFIIPGKAYVPKPDVDCGLVRLVPRALPLIRLPFALVEKVCRHVFHFRRKSCVRGVETLYPPELKREFSDEMLRRVRVSPYVQCTQLGIDEVRDMCHVYDEQCLRVPGLYRYDYRNPKMRKLEELANDAQRFPERYKFVEEFSDGVLGRRRATDAVEPFSSGEETVRKNSTSCEFS